MILYNRIVLFFFAFGILSNSVKGQAYTEEGFSDTTFALKRDTLFTNKGFRIYAGQALITGKGSAENNWYRSIGFKSDFSFPVWVTRDMEEKNNYDYQAYPQKRINDKVQQYLSPGDTLIVKKIKRDGNKHTGHWYTVVLRSKKTPFLNFRCNLLIAIPAKELLIAEKTSAE